jgi:Leucine-rich repeat (LRR) protein
LGVFEKTLCYVKKDFTAYKAKQDCLKNGMILLDPKTSTSTLTSLTAFGQSVLGGSPRAEVHVAGRNGNRCTALLGNGTLKTVNCIRGLNFLCEKGPKINLCKNYYASSLQETYMNLSGIIEPRACEYYTPIKTSGEVVSVNATFDRNRIVSLFVDGALTSEFLPSKIAENFPKLQYLKANRNQITTISKGHLIGLNNLQIIQMSKNKVTKILSDTFDVVPQLQYLDLSK